MATVEMGEEVRTKPQQNGQNPYELRFNLLHLAKDIVEQNAHFAREANDPDQKVSFTTEDVINTAKRLNDFVSFSK